VFIEFIGWALEWTMYVHILTNYGYRVGECPKAAWQTLWWEQPSWKNF